jgi:hypothetical protein
MATPTTASPIMHSYCFHEFVKRDCSKTTEPNLKRFFASGAEFLENSTQTAQICKNVSPSQRKLKKTCFRYQVRILHAMLACN